MSKTDTPAGGNWSSDWFKLQIGSNVAQNHPMAYMATDPHVHCHLCPEDCAQTYLYLGTDVALVKGRGVVLSLLYFNEQAFRVL